MKKGQLVVFKKRFNSNELYEVLNEYEHRISVSSVDESSYQVGSTPKIFFRKASRRDIEKYLARKLKKELIKNFTEVI